MKVVSLNINPNTYTSNSYLILGDWNKLEDINCLIDTGSDNYILKSLKKVNTGLGKSPVDNIYLTHNHFDHTGGVDSIKKSFKARVFAYTISENVDNDLFNDQILKMGDSYAEVIHAPAHSSDSVCYYFRKEGILFSGDVNLDIKVSDAVYTFAFMKVLEKLRKLKIKVIYPGHGSAITNKPDEMISRSIENITKCPII